MASFKQTRNPSCEPPYPSTFPPILCAATHTKAANNRPHALDDLVDVSLWGHVEASTCVILACIPRISLFFMRLYRKHHHSRRADQNLHSADDPSVAEKRGSDRFARDPEAGGGRKKKRLYRLGLASNEESDEISHRNSH